MSSGAANVIPGNVGAAAGTRTMYLRAFTGLLSRDLRVLRREIGPFVLRIVMQPLLFLFVFTFVMPRIAQGNAAAASGGSMIAGGAGFGTILLPGLMAVAIMFSGIAAVALPLSQEFGITREIDDRVMCPLPVAAVAIEKVCFSAVQSIMAAFLVLPLAYYIPAVPVRAHVTDWFFAGAVLVLSSLVAGALGLAIGANIKPQQIGLVFSIVVVPITFLGCVYYPWAYLGKVRWLQILVLLNPIVYMSEGLRAALTPEVAHMPEPAILAALVISLSILGAIGLKGFLRKVIS